MGENKNLIGLCGYAGSGKSEFAMELWRLAGLYVVKGYSRKLKEIAAILTGYDMDDFEKQDFKASLMDDEWTDKLSGHRPTYREFLQKLGTEVMRDRLHSEVWVNAMFADYRPPKMDEYYPSKWIIADVRFVNEAYAIRSRGGILVRLDRGKPVNGHISETALDEYYFDHVIDNNGDLPLLKHKAKEFYEKFMA